MESWKAEDDSEMGYVDEGSDQTENSEDSDDSSVIVVENRVPNKLI